MTKVEAIIQVSKLDAVKDALHEVGVEGMTVFEARGHGRQKGHTEFYRGREYTVDLIPKVKLEIVVADEMKEKVVQAITTRRVPARSATGRFFFRALTKRFGFATTNVAIACCKRRISTRPRRSTDLIEPDESLRLRLAQGINFSMTSGRTSSK
jgi:nitrogen regulatory protein P-II 1